MTTRDEAYEEMQQRCDWSTTMARTEGQDDDGAALGCIIDTLDGGFLAVETGVTPDGLAYVSARVFDRDGAPLPVGIAEIDGSVMLTG